MLIGDWFAIDWLIGEHDNGQAEFRRGYSLELKSCNFNLFYRRDQKY